MALEKEVQEVLTVLEQALGLRGRSASFTPDTPLLGALPELDSMAVLALITLIEERYGIAIQDDAMEASAFATVGTLADWLSSQRARG